jgi:hypothetical protein
LEDTGLGGGQKRVAVLGTVLERGGADEQVMFKPMEVLGDGSVKGVSGVGAKVSGEEKNDFQNGETVDKPKRGKCRRVERIGTGNGAGESKTEFCKKRGAVEMEVEDMSRVKRVKDVDIEMTQVQNVEAGLSEQLRGAQ